MNDKQIVTLTRCEDYQPEKIHSCLEQHLQFLGGLEKFIKKGDSVLIKPNFIAPRPARFATQTNPAVIIELAKILKDFGAKPFVADSTAWANVITCARALDLIEPLKKLNVPLKSLNKPRDCRLDDGTVIPISSVALDADAIINLPKFKSHQQLITTFAIKNMFGVVSGKRKALLHFSKGKTSEKFCKMLINIFKYMHPVFTIIDTVEVMDGQGPINGRTRPLGWLVGGIEPVAIEIACCKLVNIDPLKIPMINQARKMNFGTSDFENICILGDDFSGNICTDFILPELTPVRFSLPRVIKSVGKQAVILLKSFLKPAAKI